jgi:hypothetical protein
MHANRQGLLARRDARLSEANTVSALATAVQPNATMLTPPVYLLARDEAGRFEVMPTLEKSVDFMKNTLRKMGYQEVPGKVIQALAGDSKSKVYKQRNAEGQVIPLTEYRGPGYAVFTNESPYFKDQWMEMYLNYNARGNVFGGRMDRNGEPALFTIDKTKERVLNRKLAVANRADKPSVLAIRGDQLEVVRVPLEQQALLQKAPAVQLASGEWVARVMYSDGPRLQVFTDAEHAQMAQKVKLNQGDQWFYQYTIATKIKNGEIVEAISDPRQVRKLLRGFQMLYKLTDGRTLTGDQLPPNLEQQRLAIMEIIDPTDGTTVKLGSEWARLNYLMNQGVREENVIRERRSDNPPSEVIEVYPNGEPADVKRYKPQIEWRMLRYLNRLSAEIQTATTPDVAQSLYDKYQDALERRTFFEEHPNVFQGPKKYIIKGTKMQRAMQAAREWQNVSSAYLYDTLNATGKGGEIVIPGGAGIRLLSLIEADINDINKRISEIEKEIDVLNNSKGHYKEIKALERERRGLEEETVSLMTEANGVATRLSMMPSKADTISFADNADYLAAKKEQDDYVQSLVTTSNNLQIPERQRTRAERMFKIVSKTQSRMDQNGNEHVLVSPLERTRNRALLQERLAQADREALDAQRALMMGKPVVLVWKLQRVNGALETSLVERDPADIEKAWRARIAAERNPQNKIVYEQRLKDLLANETVADLDINEEGEKY